MPIYYIMVSGRSMPETVEPEMPAGGGAACAWLMDRELGIYVAEYA
jgi:hypothetical protein